MKHRQGKIFVVPGASAGEELGAAIGKFRVELDPTSDARAFVVRDCFDQSLRQSGRVLVETGGELHLLGEDGLVRRQTAERAGNFTADLAQGPVRAALAGLSPLRALMPICRGELLTRSLVVQDEKKKPQVTGSLWVLETESGVVTLIPVPRPGGQGKAYEKLCRRLSDLDGAKSGVGDLYAALAPGLAPYEAKPAIPLEKAEPARQVANDIIRTYLQVARQNEAGVIADIDTEFLHDYRISLRKIRSVLSLFKGVYAPAQTDQLKQAFSEHMAATGRLRDLDVYLLDRDGYFDLLPDCLHGGLQVMFDRFQEERTAEQKRLVRRLKSNVYDKAISGLADIFAEPCAPTPGPNADRAALDYACELIWKRYCKVCKLALSITDDTPDEALHRLRIDCKKLRYLMEFFAPLFDAGAFRKLIKPLKKLQDNLGRFNDCAVQRQSLLAFVEHGKDKRGRADAGMAMAVGGLIAVLDQHQGAERAALMSNFARFDEAEVRRIFRSLFHDRTG